MWRPRTITLEVGRHLYRLKHTDSGWQPVDEPLPDGLWEAVAPKITRGIRWWRVLQVVWLFVIASQLLTMRWLRGQAAAGATPAPMVSMIDWLSVLPTLGFLALLIQVARGPLHIWHYSSSIKHRPRCRKCSYSLHGLDLDDTQSLICPECGTQN